jgi:hypothetical protein
MTTLEATSITHSFQGRFGFGIDQWAYVPFDVPAGIQRSRLGDRRPLSMPTTCRHGASSARYGRDAAMWPSQAG